MAKSRAEIQKAYRQRKKEKDNDAYLRKERERRRKSYVLSGELTSRERNRRNEKNRQNLSRHREENEVRNNSLDSSGYDSGTASKSQNSPLIVNMPFILPNRRNGARRRTS
ncbi:hypothetical protein LOTGIDRAFT_163160 [Lottia gigantea]|uniref:Uncharacterized protein n=1 Tax=Lottia gigantea TaxID=225164 RepID=V4A9P9_LOTGI|nr:hypothetical protein LOTGIDRAFT_163160 [Lottia gigantea]ESO91800.1 hypothetical protein LOTGIDRAFT_163160 [Lottia gigantea]